MFLWGPFPVRTNTEELTLRRDDPSVGRVSVTVALQSGSAWRQLAIGGRLLPVSVRYESEAVQLADAGCLAVAGRVLVIGGRCIQFQPGGTVPAKGDRVTLKVEGRRIAGVLTDWGYSITAESVGEWTGTIADASYRLLAVVRSAGTIGGVQERAELARAIGERVGLSVHGAEALAGSLDVEPVIGERWLDVWRRVLSGTAWRVEDGVLRIGDLVGRRVFFEGHYSVEPIETGRATTVGVHDGVLIGVAGRGLPDEVADVSSEAELLRVHRAAGLGAARVRVEGVEAGDVRPGDLVEVSVPGLDVGFRKVVVDELKISVDEKGIPTVRVALLPVGTVETRAYG